MKQTLLAAFLSLAAVSASANSPYIACVYEFCPAPGQFVHSVPAITDDMTRTEIISEVESQICGNDDYGATPGMISLGAFGGYVIFGFDHPVVNVSGQPDFKIYGNSFRDESGNDGGTSEPGIVMVSIDTNGNGLPDDEWYELAGSEHSNPATIRDFEITYTRPADNTADIAWTSNSEKFPSGVVMRNQFHTQSYWPAWYAGETLTFKGTRLPDNAYDKSGNGSFWTFRPFDWGYVDNHPNATDAGLDIDNAIDADGNKVSLTQIDFVKVYTAISQNCGWVGETSTEICGGEDLHPDIEVSINNISVPALRHTDACYDMYGRPVSDPSAPGIYIRMTAGGYEKVLVR